MKCNMTKILMVLDNAFRPDQRVLKELQTLLKLNSKVDLYCWDHDSDLEEQELRDGVNIRRIKIKVAKQIGVAKIKYLMKFYRRLFKVLKQNKTKYDFVYVHDFLLLPLGIALKYKIKSKLIYDAHEIYHLMEWEKYSPIVRTFMFLMERTLLKFVDHFIVVSEHRKNFYSNFSSKKINVIGNWFDEYQGEYIDLKEKYNIPKEDIVIGYFGVINFKVRPINTIVEKVKQYKNLHFFIGGIGPDDDKIEPLVQDATNVYYLGWLENVREYINSMDYIVYVMNNTRKYSAFTAPNTLYLAISHNKPIITNVVGEPSQIIEKYHVGYFIEDLNKYSFENLRNNEVYSKFQNNMDLIRKNYLWSKSEEVYTEILNN